MSGNTANQETFRIKFLNATQEIQDAVEKNKILELIPNHELCFVLQKDLKVGFLRKTIMKQVMVSIFDNTGSSLGSFKMYLNTDEYSALQNKKL